MTDIAATEVTTAARQLMRAGQWTAALDLLRACNTDDPDEQRALALAIAEVAVDQDFAHQTDIGRAALAAASQLRDASPTMTWDVEMLHLRKDYSTALFDSTDQATELEKRAQQLIDQAPDDARLGAVSFYAGVMADNLLNKPHEAFAHYTTALELGEKTGDELLASLALRHLGDHAHTAGDLALARRHWERSTELRQKVGHLLGALAQQTLMAVLLRDEGDVAGSRALAKEVNRWARQAGLKFIVIETEELMH